MAFKVRSFAEASLLGADLAALRNGSPVELRLRRHGHELSEGDIALRDAVGAVLVETGISSLTAAIPCFTAETRIVTEAGLRTVDALAPGMRVMTRDNGMQEILWVGCHRFDWRALGLNPLLRPVRIAQGALGRGLPDRDMVVSPNHRLLTVVPGEGERLTMARDLVGLDGITTVSCTEVGYWQVLCARHELVMGDGCWSESFRPTPLSLSALDSGARAEVETLVAEAAGLALEFAPARPLAEGLPAR